MVTKLHTGALVALAGSLALGAEASAAKYTATYTGTVVYAQDETGRFGSDPTGSTVTAVFTYDEADAGGWLSFDNPPVSSGFGGFMTAAMSFGSLSFDFDGDYAEGNAFRYDSAGSESLSHSMSSYVDHALGTNTRELWASAYGTGTNFLDSWNYRTVGTYDLTGSDSASGFAEFEAFLWNEDLGNTVLVSSDRIDFAFTSMTITSTAAPEPGSWALMLLGFGGAGTALRRRRMSLA